jgi:hypothetical protein
MKFTTQHGLDKRTLTITLPVQYVEAFKELSDKSALRHNGYLTCDFSLPHKPKTDGEKSQNSHAWGHATTIAAGLNQGDDPRDVLYDACIATAGYPTRMNKFGRVVAQSWSLATTVQAAAVIETLHRLAAEFGIKLIEGEQDG